MAAAMAHALPMPVVADGSTSFSLRPSGPVPTHAVTASAAMVKSAARAPSSAAGWSSALVPQSVSRASRDLISAREAFVAGGGSAEGAGFFRGQMFGAAGIPGAASFKSPSGEKLPLEMATVLCAAEPPARPGSDRGPPAARKGRGKMEVNAVLADMAKRTTPEEELTHVIQLRERALPRNVISVILGGGAGTRLYPLTRHRAKPAVPIGGAYRLIDVPMSNCINCGIKKIFILTQFNSTSLNRHLAKTYNSGGITFADGFVEVLAATQTPGEGGQEWFQGTADAVRQYLWLLEQDLSHRDVEDILILSGDHLYRMDYMDFVQRHKDTGADITISVLPIDDSRASDYGLMKTDDKGRVVSFAEKPKGQELAAMAVDTTILGLSAAEAKEKPYIASMGIYVFKKKTLIELLRSRYPHANDFGSEIIPSSAGEFNVQAYLFNDYWEDIGTMRSFFEANLGLTRHPARFSFYDAQKPIYTSPRNLPPSKIEKCRVKDSIISHGCFLRSCAVKHSIIGLRSRVEQGVDIADTMMMGADYYETDAERAALLASGRVPIGVGENTVLRNCIIDKNARIGRNCRITNEKGVKEAEMTAQGYYIRDGIVVILKNASIYHGTVI
ncbi:hypothetical protein CBR_g37593 [Chara braunii]|uniref:Glucose-1-phosphate adenylyltransferase n=1 Tax=Chara braunii TaxID=69332 RepID=A0A388LNJ6_CHABU|nr:hypothetical protein CBR_g37593 [Chara braunii]|eukprot:GBG83793.1 hypothetical protein CBR_g37593 [Chara braunii]